MQERENIGSLCDVKTNLKEGFEVVSKPFMEDGIPHVKMEKRMD